MNKIALAGGTSGVGHAFWDALEAQQAHAYILLTRKPIDNPKAVVVDYSDVDALKSVLEAHNVTTVISAISIADESSGQAQLNLIKAADLSTKTKRFLPSEFGADYTPEHVKMIPTYAWKLQARDVLAKTRLEYSIVSNGIFLDYWGRPRVPTRLHQGRPLFIDLANKCASIPGNGDQILVLSHSVDVARHVMYMLDLPTWGETNFFVGERLTINEFAAMAEEILGMFKVSHDTTEDLIAGKVTMLPAYGPPSEPLISFFSGLHLLSTKGYFDINAAKRESSQVSSMKSIKVKDIIEAWKE